MSSVSQLVAFYGLLGVWAVLLVVGMRRQSYRDFLGFGIGILLVLNVRYFIEGPEGAIPFFVGIYDLFDNFGLSSGDEAGAMATCVDNACSAWGDRYDRHPAWGVAFYERFANGPQLRRNLLYGHIFFNSIAFVLMHIQLLKPGTGDNRSLHRRLGRISFAAVTVGTILAIWLASEHGSVGEYGGNLAMFGFYSMSACVYITAILGVTSIRRGDTAAHRTWMIRYAGAMWGAFWLFRVMLVVTGPLLRNYESVSILISIWFSAPLGILIAELFRRRSTSAGSNPRAGVLTEPESRPAAAI